LVLTSGNRIYRNVLSLSVVMLLIALFVVLYSYRLVNFYMYVFGTIILYEIMSKLCPKLAFEPAIICPCDLFGIFR
jgi:predicted membrane protein